MPVLFQSRIRTVRLNRARVIRLADRILSELDESASELSLSCVGDRLMRGLNRRYRRRDCTTDVLAFAVREGPMAHRNQLGDVVISLPTAARQAQAAGRSIDMELVILLIHGILHLCGYDHEHSERDARLMRRREQIILGKLGAIPRLVR